MTVKHALPLPAGVDGHLTQQMRSFLEEVLRRHYELPAPAELAPTLRVGYRRATLTQLGRENRMTVDSNLQMTSRGGHALLHPDLVLVETKSLSGRSAADRALRAAGARPSSVSKYCAGIALLDASLPKHPWRRLLRRHFATTTALRSGAGKELAA